MNEFIKLYYTIFLLIKQIKNPIKKKILATWSFEQSHLELFLVDEAIVDDGAADLLVELEERLHLVHRDLAQLNARKRASDRTALRENGGRTSQPRGGVGKDRIFTASGIGGEARELAEVEGGPVVPA
jgi:hypothetical protein